MANNRLDLGSIQWDQPALKPTETPGYKGQVAGATATASTLGGGILKDEYLKQKDGTLVFGQRNQLTNAFHEYPQWMQPPKIAMNPEDLVAAKEDAIRRAVIAKGLESKSKDWFATGFLAPTLSQYGGTNAADVQADVDSLKAGGALNVLIDMAKKTGKNLLSPMSASDVELISNAKQFPLAINQGDDQFQQNSRRYYEAARRAYLATGGKAKDFETQVMRLMGQANGRASGIKVERIR